MDDRRDDRSRHRGALILSLLWLANGCAPDVVEMLAPFAGRPFVTDSTGKVARGWSADLTAADWDGARYWLTISATPWATTMWIPGEPVDTVEYGWPWRVSAGSDGSGVRFTAWGHDGASVLVPEYEARRLAAELCVELRRPVRGDVELVARYERDARGRVVASRDRNLVCLSFIIRNLGSDTCEFDQNVLRGFWGYDVEVPPSMRHEMSRMEWVDRGWALVFLDPVPPLAPARASAAGFESTSPAFGS